MTAEARRRVRLHRVLAALDIEPVAVEPVADAMPWARAPRSFRVTTRRHGVMKVRLMRGRHRAQRAVALAAALADPRIPVPIGCVGAATVERWVDGTVLTPPMCRPEHIVEAAGLLAAIHRFPGLGPDERLPGTRATPRFAARAAEQLRDLEVAGRLTTAEHDALSAVLDGLPPRSAWGLTHNDFCASNLVLMDDGSLVSIDNEHFMRGFLEYDVARVWYRWPMPVPAAELFASVYRRQRGPTPPDEEERAWRAVASLKGAHHRLRVGAPDDEALRALRALIP
jgi:aminoglycoside phosphotransferase (APT) family kinase protein